MDNYEVQRDALWAEYERQLTVLNEVYPEGETRRGLLGAVYTAKCTALYAEYDAKRAKILSNQNAKED